MKRVLFLVARVLGCALVVITLSSVNVFASDIKQANKLVNSYYAAYIKGDAGKIASLFASDARGLYVTKIGYGLPNDVYKFKGKDVKGMVNWEVPEKYRSFMENYKETGHSFSIKKTVKKGNAIKVTARLTSKYSTTKYKGNNFQDDIFLIEIRNGKPKIVDYEGLAYFD